MTIRIGDVAPNFTQTSTQGPVDLYQWSAGNWVVLFSHPKDFTPVCTTELGAVAKLKGEFDKRNVKVVGLSVDPLTSHTSWANDIEETQGTALNFPLLADADRKVSLLYGFIHPQASDTFTVRSVVIIDPTKKVRLIITYPASTGRNFDEILRVIDSLQLTDKFKVATPVNWKQGDDVIISPAVKEESELNTLFPKGFKAVKPYLRFTPQPALRALVAGFLAISTFLGVNAHAEEDVPAQTVEQRLAILERKYEVDQEAAAAAAKTNGVVTAGKDGFIIKSADGASFLKLTGYVQTDYRDYLADQNQFTDQLLLRRIRPSFEGTINKVVDFRILADFANNGGSGNTATTQANGQAGSTVGGSLLQDAYVELKTFPGAKVRVGKFKGPVSLERLQSGTALTFVERAFPTSLAPNRDVGLQLSGDFIDGTVSYQAGIFNGVVDGTSGETDSTDGKDYIGRLFLHPFKQTAGFLQGLGIGVAGSIGDQIGAPTATASQALPSYRTAGQQTFFSYRSGDTYANGTRTRVSPQGYWYNNNLGLFGEYTISRQDITRATTTTTTDSIANRAWVVAGSWVLTGEKTSFRGVKPKKDFDPKKGGWGALELAARYSELRVDDKVFPRYANIQTAAKRAQAWGGGLNWYLNNNVKVTSDYEYTSFEGGATVGNRRPERVILSRVQLTY